MKKTMQNLSQNQCIIDALLSNIHGQCQRRFTVEPDLSQGTHQTPLLHEACKKLFASYIYKITIRQRQYYYCPLSVYCPPRFTITEDQFLDFYNSLGDRFIAEAGYNEQLTPEKFRT